MRQRIRRRQRKGASRMGDAAIKAAGFVLVGRRLHFDWQRSVWCNIWRLDPQERLPL